MLTAKEALVRDGIIEKVTRGRISGAGHAHLNKLHTKGERFKDWPKGEVTVTKSEDSETVKVKRDASETGFVEAAPYRYDESEFKAVENVSKRERSMRDACICGYSLVGCWCENPRIVALPPMMGHVAVTIVRK